MTSPSDEIAREDVVEYGTAFMNCLTPRVCDIDSRGSPTLIRALGTQRYFDSTHGLPQRRTVESTGKSL